MKTFIALLCMGKPDFECVRELQNDVACYQNALHLNKGFPSSATLPQRMDEIRSKLRMQLLAYNILRLIGQEAVRQGNAPAKRVVSRKRVRTVIQNLIHFAGHVTQHARQLLLPITDLMLERIVFLPSQGNFASLDFHGFRKTDLRKAAGISSSFFAKLGKNENVQSMYCSASAKHLTVSLMTSWRLNEQISSTLQA